MNIRIEDSSVETGTIPRACNEAFWEPLGRALLFLTLLRRLLFLLFKLYIIESELEMQIGRFRVQMC